MASESEQGSSCTLQFAIAVAWLAIWYFYLSSQHQAAIADLPDCRWYYLSCDARWGQANNAFSSRMLFAFLSIPLPILLIRFARSALASRAESAENRRKLANQRELEIQQQRKIELLTDHAQAEKGKIRRAEFIHKLGAVTDFVELLPFETEPERMHKIRQGLSVELRAIIAAYTLDEIAQLFREDPAIRIKVECMLASLEQAGIRSSDGAVISQALSRAAPNNP